jgi:RimJ/RimL family protein N-acetyltransferase
MGTDLLTEPAGPGNPPVLSLHPFTAAAASSIEHWFDHPEVRHRLGGRPWIQRELRLMNQRPDTDFRGKTVLRSCAWIPLDQASVPVAFISGDVYDRWVRYHGEGPHGPLLSDDDPRTSMSLTYVVDPARWRHGYGRATLTAVLTHPDLTDVRAFYCGIDADNHASQRCAATAGFQLLDPTPDFEDTLYYRYAR